MQPYATWSLLAYRGFGYLLFFDFLLLRVTMQVCALTACSMSSDLKVHILFSVSLHRWVASNGKDCCYFLAVKSCSKWNYFHWSWNWINCLYSPSPVSTCFRCKVNCLQCNIQNWGQSVCLLVCWPWALPIQWWQLLPDGSGMELLCSSHFAMNAWCSFLQRTAR